MCLIVFVASDNPLPIISNDAEQPLFTAHPIADESGAVKQFLSKPYVVEVTYGGCGCGFTYDLSEEESVYQTSRAMMRRLRDYIAAALHKGSVDVYCCWYGDWAASPEARMEVGLEHFGGDAFQFNEKALWRILWVAVKI